MIPRMESTAWRRGAFVLAFLLCVGVTSMVSAKVGVGMGAGEIRLTDGIKPGGIYEIPSVRIFNTGDETTTYGMGIAYHQDRHELRPGKEWFSFNPATFTLEPGKSQDISVTMTVPLKVEQGDYFAFVESGPVHAETPGTSVGIAVATKLFFTVIPANMFQALSHRFMTFMEGYTPWSWVVLGVFGLIIFLLILRRFISFNVSFKKG